MNKSCQKWRLFAYLKEGGMKLTEKQKKFADFYIKLGNATQAAIKAGYSEKTARFTGWTNVKYLDTK